MNIFRHWFRRKGKQDTDAAENPWAGLASYEDPDTAERKLKFCGRDDESYDVAKLIMGNIFVTLYGKSGIGKTSLLNAGVFPEVREEQFLPISLRLGMRDDKTSESYQSVIIRAIESASHRMETFPVIPEQGDTQAVDYLWNYFARHRFYNKSDVQVTPVVVMDQFEEVFRYDHKEIETLLRQLDYLNDKDHTLDHFEVDGKAYHYETNFRFVVSIREDDLYRLEDRIDNGYLPGLKRCRYRLRSLSEEGAKKVIQIPGEGLFGRDEQEKEKIVQTIIQTARNKEDHSISTNLLSLVCNRIFVDYQRAGSAYISLSLVTDFIKDNPFKRFYNEATRGFSNREKSYLEDHLVDSDGRRNSIPQSDFLRHVPHGEKLLGGNTRILQRINSRVELIHDSFCAPLDKLKQERELRKKIALILKIAVLVVILGGFFYLCIAVIKNAKAAYEAKAETLEAKVEALEAKAETLEAKAEAFAARERAEAARGWAKYITSVFIPESVTSIGDYAFFGCSSLPSVVIPEGVTSIGEFAFYGCSSLTSMVIPESVTSIGDAAFMYCSSLISVVIPESVTSIGAGAFDGCSSLTSVVIPEGVSSIGSSAFAGCSSLTSVVIPESVTSIGDGAFFGCSSLTSVVIPEGVTSIGTSAFTGCSSLTSVVIPKGVTSIDTTAFSLCSSLTSVVIPKGVTSIEVSAFIECSSLTSVVIPESVTSIGDAAFSGCSSLTSVVIPESVTSIGAGTFSGCSSLTSVVIPESVTSIGAGTFSGCSSLTSIAVSKKNPVYDSRENCNAIIETGTNTIVFGCQNTVIPESVTSIGDGAFFECSSLTSVVIPEGVTSIGASAFFGCSSLTSVVIPESVTSIGDCAFTECSSLTFVVIPEGVTSIEMTAFSGCSSLTSVVIPESVTSIETTAFSGCSSLTSVIIPESVTSIGAGTFSECSSLTSVIIPESVTSIKPFAFSECSSLTSVVIPKCVTSIGWNAFSGCSSLTSVVIPGSVTEIGDRAFWDCQKLKELHLLSSKPPKIDNGDPVSNNDSIVVYVPRGSKKYYAQAEGWKEFLYIIEN